MVRVVLFLVISGLAHFLGARWLVSTFSPAARRSRRFVVFGTAALLSLLLATVRLVASMDETRAMRMAVAIVMVELAVVVLALMPIGVMTVVARVVERLARWRRAEPAVPKEIAVARESEVITRRQAVERVVGLSIFGATSAALGWGMVRGRHAFAIEEVVVRVKDWPRALDGYVIAQVSDVHVGAFVGERELAEGFELVTHVRPDLVVATGDLVDFEADAVGPLARRLMNVNARDGAFAILGNHDHYAGAADVVSRLRAAGVHALCNQSLRLRGGDGGGFALVGLDDLQGRSGRSPGFAGPDLAAAVAGMSPDLPRILLAHQPRFFAESSGRVALQLSGHTHGGQINPGFRPADLVMKYVAGRYERDGSTLYVNRGFGVAGPPSRVGAPPEITKIVIVAA